MVETIVVVYFSVKQLPGVVSGGHVTSRGHFTSSTTQISALSSVGAVLAFVLMQAEANHNSGTLLVYLCVFAALFTLYVCTCPKPPAPPHQCVL